MQKGIRYIIIALIIIVLVIISVGIVKFVPKAMNGLANATVSFGSIFDGNTNTDFVPTPATATSSTSTPPVKPSINTGTNNDDYNVNDIIPPRNTVSNLTPSRPTYNYPTTGGSPDLVVTIIEQGVLNRTSGQYITSNTFSTNDVVSVKFRVDNRGTGATGAWSLRVNMPSSVQSDTQKVFSSLTSLPAGSAITGTAVFDRPVAGAQQITIMADYLATIVELNETNNTAVATIQVQGGNNNGNNGNPGNLSCPNGYYLTFINGAYTCAANNNYGTNCPFGYYSAYVNGVYQCYPNNGGTGTGGPDLQVRVLEFGTIDPYTNQFYSNGNLACNQTYPTNDCSTGAYVRQGQRAAVRFQIYNAGGQASGQFFYQTSLANNSSQNRTAGPEVSLQPGATNTYTVGFDTPTLGSNTMIIFADSQSSVNESNENNNVMRVNFTISPYTQF